MNNFENRQNNEKESTLLDRIQDMYNVSFSSRESIFFLSQKICDFFTEIKAVYPEVNLNGIPELEKLRGGGEDEDVTLDEDVLREIRKKIDVFVTAVMAEMKNQPKIAKFDIREVMKKALTSEKEDEVDTAIRKVKEEVQGMYTPEVLARSESWHAFAGSSLQENHQPLPQEVENGVHDVIQNLLERKIIPLLS